MERAGGDEKNVIRTDESVTGVDSGSFDDGENVALHAFAADVGAMAAFTAGDFVDLVEENDAAGLDSFERYAYDVIHVNELLLFFLHQVIEGFGDMHLAF